MCARTQGSARGPFYSAPVFQPRIHSHGRVLSHLLSNFTKSVRNMPGERMALSMTPCDIVEDIINKVCAPMLKAS
jgi:hypothetical protein